MNFYNLESIKEVKLWIDPCSLKFLSSLFSGHANYVSCMRILNSPRFDAYVLVVLLFSQLGAVFQDRFITKRFICQLHEIEGGFLRRCIFTCNALPCWLTHCCLSIRWCLNSINLSNDQLRVPFWIDQNSWI